MHKLTRREFIAIGGKAAAGAVILSACGVPEQELLVQSPADQPEDLARGEDAWYATTWPDYPGGDGLIARVVRGRVKKLAGNPDHPVNLGKQSVSHDSSIQLLYHPDRITRPLLRRSKGARHGEVSWDLVMQFMADAVSNGVVVVTNPLRGILGRVADEFVNVFSGRRVNFDPLEQGVLHNTTRRIFNSDRLPDFDIANAQTVLSFGADWMSGWVSPTRYSALYGRFRSGEQRGYLIHVEPRFSVVAANADLWLPVKPGTEGDVALAIGKVIVDNGLASTSEIRAFEGALPAGALRGFQLRDVANRSGVSQEKIAKAAQQLAGTRPAVVFGGGSAAAHTNGSFALAAIYSLNHLTSSTGTDGGVVINPESPLQNATGASHGDPLETLEQEVAQWRARFVDTVIIRGADLVHGLPAFVQAGEALRNVPNVIAFANVMNDTAAQADLILPETLFLEEWGVDVPDPAPGYQTISLQQPLVGQPPSEVGVGPRSFGDVLLALMGGLGGATNMRELVINSAGTLFERGSGSIRASNSELFLRGALQRGGWWDTTATASGAARPINPLQGSQGQNLSTEAQYSTTNGIPGNEFHLLPFESNSLANGRLAATPWAQQSPDPISSIAWTTWAEINHHDADNLGIQEGDVLLIRSEAGEIQVVAYPHPGAAPGIISVPIGLGHNNSGRFAEERGSNVLKILANMKDEDSGAFAWAATRVKVERLGRRVKVPKFEGDVEAFPAEPGVPVLVVAPGETAEEAEAANHHLYQQEFLGQGRDEKVVSESKEEADSEH